VPAATLMDNLTVVISSPSSSFSLQALKVRPKNRVMAVNAKKVKWWFLLFLIVFFMVFKFDCFD
jgi:hypothetical protein